MHSGAHKPLPERRWKSTGEVLQPCTETVFCKPSYMVRSREKLGVNQSQAMLCSNFIYAQLNKKRDVVPEGLQIALVLILS